MKNKFILLVLFFSYCIFSYAQWSDMTKVVSGDRAISDFFGRSVAISGDYALVGSQYDDEDANGGNPLEDAGAAYIFKREGTTWVQQQKLVASDRAATDYFGYTVALEGDYAVISAVSSNNNGGSVYVFKKNGEVWQQQQKIIASDTSNGDVFGASVDISGNTIIIGAHFNSTDSNGGNYIGASGSAYVFVRDGNIWLQQQKLVASDRAFDDRFGFGVSISGEYAVVSAYYEDEDENGENPLTDAGSAYIFKRNGNIWSQQQKIVNADRQAGDNFGTSVSMDGEYLIVGASFAALDANGENSLPLAGSAYIYVKNGDNWEQQQKITASDRSFYAQYGCSVSIKNNKAIVGAIWAVGKDGAIFAGSAYAYKREENDTWIEQQKIVTIDDSSTNDSFGCSVDLSDNYIIVGAQYEAEDANGENPLTDAGSAYIYKSCETDTSITVTETELIANFTEDGVIYQWLDCDNGNVPIAEATFQTFTPAHGGNYAVQITRDNGCISVSECVFFCGVGEVTITQVNLTLTASIEGNAVSYQWYNCDGNTAIEGATEATFTATETGEYSVIVTDDLGCESTSECVQVCLGVNTNIQVQGNVLTALYGDGTFYQWLDCDNGNEPIDGATGQSYEAPQSGSYSVQITDGFGCVSTSACVAVCIPIDLTVTFEDGTLTAAYNEDGATYQWIDCNNNNEPIDGATGQSFTPADDGYYAVIITDAYGCVNISACYDTEMLDTENLNQSDLAIYPNPVKDYLNISTGKGQLPAGYFIYNSLGQRISQKSILNEADLKINVKSFESGIYIINIISENETKSFKFIVK